MEDELKKLEQELMKCCPEKMPGDMLTRMAQAMDSWQERSAETKVIPFPEAKRSWLSSSFLTAAATVAILGIAAALFWPTASQESGEVVKMLDSPFQLVSAQTSPSPPQVLVSHDTRQNFVNASPVGFVRTSDGRPHRAYVLQQVEEMEFRDAPQPKQTLHIQKPLTKLVLVPVQID